MIRALDRKLLRESRRLWAQLLSIALVVACGIVMVMTLGGTYLSLASSLERYYRDYRFADVFASLERAPEPLREQVARVPGVAAVETRVTLTATLDVPGLPEPAVGQFVSLPPAGARVLDDVHLVRGRWPDAERTDEVLVSESFASANGLGPGARLGALLDGAWRTLTIVGVAISPDFIGEVAPGAVFPDDRRFAVVRMDADALAAAAGMTGAFNDLAVRLAPGASEPRVIERLDRLLEPYGGRGAYGRGRHPSHEAMVGELEQNRISGILVSAIFLSVAAFLLSVVLGRLVTTQRGEIAVLKAFGYGDAAVAQHYLRFALLPVLPGAALGAGLGVWLGHSMIQLYAQYFRFPDLEYRVSWPLAAGAVGVSVLAGVLGALGAARRAVRLQPAEAMRPEAPARFRPGPLERLGLGRRLSTSARLIVRGIERRPLRSLASMLGVALATGLVAIGFLLLDSTDYTMEHQFERVQREDLALTFTAPRPASIRHDLAHLDGVTRVELTRAEPVRVRHLHRERTTVLTGVEPGGRLRRIVDREARARPVPAAGLVVNTALAEALGVGVGDTLEVSLLLGRRERLRLPVVGTVDELFGLSAYMDFAALHAVLDEAPAATGAFLAVEDTRVHALNDRLKRLRPVASVYSPGVLRATFEEMMSETMLVWVTFTLALACVLAVGVIYNGARIALSERGRELASLRVLGFTRREVAVLLLGEQAVLTLAAIPVGFALGVAFVAYILAQIPTDRYRLPLVMTAETFLLAALATAAAAAAAGFAVRRRLDRFDLVEVLKTRE